MITEQESNSRKAFSLPKPDLSAFIPHPSQEDIDGERDIGWAEREWKDGRPYRAELRSWKDLTVVTFFFSTLGLETAEGSDLAALLDKESMVGRILRDPRGLPGTGSRFGGE